MSPFPARALLLGALLAAMPAGAAWNASKDLPDLVERILPSVVNISAITIQKYTVYGMDDFLRFWGIPQERKVPTLGTGFIIDSERGYVLTNNHVVEAADEVVVIMSDKRQFPARIAGKDPKLDVALLVIRDGSRKVPPGLVAATAGDSEKVRIAESVVAIGNPFGLSHTVTTGIISARNRTIGLGPYDSYLQTDALINPGNSGGPLFDLEGKVIGINTFIKTGPSGGMGFAIPINAAMSIVPLLEKYGRVPRPWLGILCETVTPTLASYYGLGAQAGVVVYNLYEGSPAIRAGLRRGDVVTAVDGKEAASLHDLESVLARLKPTDLVTLSVIRAGKKREIKVQLEELPRSVDELPQGII